MSLDIVEIALDGMTDHREFEKLASEIMRDEGYSNIKPLGGVSDKGRDAVQESFFISKPAGRNRIVFQYTLQEYLSGKLTETIDKLSNAGIKYHELVIVTPHMISTERQDTMIQRVRKDYGVRLSIYERKTLANRLADFSNGIFHRHFPDIDKQVASLKTRRPVLSVHDAELFEESMLKASICFTFGRAAPRARKSIFDFLILGLLLENPSQSSTMKQLCARYGLLAGRKSVQEAQVRAAVKRLISRGFVGPTNGNVKPTALAIKTMAGSTIQANEASSMVISDIVERICQASDGKVSDQDRQIIARNTRNVLVKLFQLFGIELANQVLRDKTPSPVYLDSCHDLVDTAKRQLPDVMGELLVSAISEIIKAPTGEQAKALTNWSLAYLGVVIMNLDPELKEFQATCLAEKMFILDTDFVLDCLVQECPRSPIYLELVGILRNLGCRVIIPESCLLECITHAQISPRTYYHFDHKLLALGDSFVDEHVWNIFVKGYYYGRSSGIISPRTSFEEYLHNYYEPSDPDKFLRNAIMNVFPAGVEIVNPTTLLKQSIPEKIMNAVCDELYGLIAQAKKSEYRSESENRKLAETDGRLFLTALYLNGEVKRPTGRILGGRCYLVTTSSRYLRSSRKVGLRDVVTTRPQSLIALLDMVGGFRIAPSDFMCLFENPLLIHAVRSAWEDVQALLDSGIILRDKSVTRLRWDLDQQLHTKISALAEAEAQDEALEKRIEFAPSDEVYIELLQTAAARGYKRIPELDHLMKQLKEAQDDARAKARAFDALSEKYEKLEQAITHFGKRRQRYLRKITSKKRKR